MKKYSFRFLFSLGVGSLVCLASILGIKNAAVYAKETANWALQAVGQDIGNIIALPFFLITSFLHDRSLKVYVCWLGILMYYIYAYMIYAFAVHFNFLFLVYVAILGMSSYLFMNGLITVDWNNVTKYISFNLRTKVAAFFLIAIGVLFSFLWLSDIIPALLAGGQPKDLAATHLWVNPVHVIDLSFALPGMIMTGILFLRKSRYGYLFTGSWLVFSVFMGSSIVASSFLMLAQGSKDALTPLVFVGVIAGLSAMMLAIYLRKPSKF